MLRFGVFEFDPQSGELRKAGILVHLQAQPAKVLALLTGRPGQVITREELQRQIWGEDTFVDFERGLNFCVKQIREALDDDADAPRFVETLPKRGYRFIAAVERLGEEAPAAPPPARLLPWPRRIWAAVLAGVVVVAAAGYLAWYRKALWGDSRTNRVTLLVLPFENLSGDPAQEYFSDGLTEEMVTQLGRLSPNRLGVIARTTAMRYKGKQRSIADIGRELKVDYVLEGSVRRADGRVRISANLIQVSDETHLWAENYERGMENVLQIQSDVAQAILREIQVELPSDEHRRLAAAKLVDPKVYELSLKGRYYSGKLAYEQALGYFEGAIALDPGYAPAYAGLAECYIERHFLGHYSLQDTYPKARAAALKAVELEETLPEAHLALGYVLALNWEWALAGREFKHAIELAPGNSRAHQYYAAYLVVMGRPRESIAELKRALEADPLSADLGAELGGAYLSARQYGEAIQHLRLVIELHPGTMAAHRYLGMAYLQTGMYDQGIGEIQKSVGLLPVPNPDMSPELGYAYAVSGNRHLAHRILNNLEIRWKQSDTSAVDIAAIHAALGEKERALEWLERAYKEHEAALVFLRTDLRLDPLRTDPRFGNLLRHLNLAT